MSLDDDRRLTGRCLCGAVRYEIRGPSLFVSQCCCRDCQLATGTGHTTVIGIRRSQLMVSGSPVTYTSVGESGGAVIRHFCGVCGGRLYTSGTMPGEVVLVQAGSLDDPGAVSPQAVIYLKDAVPWDRFDPTLPHFDAMQTFDEDSLKAMRGEQ